MAGLLDAEHTLDPCYYFVTGRVGGFVKVDDAGGDVGFEVALVGCAPTGDWGEVPCSNED